jgi:hypothetical protein
MPHVDFFIQVAGFLSAVISFHANGMPVTKIEFQGAMTWIPLQDMLAGRLEKDPALLLEKAIGVGN